MQTMPPMPADLQDALATIDPTRILQQTRRLCSLDFAGRRVGTQGHARASVFLRQQLRLPGWTIQEQEFPITTPVLDVTSPLLLEQLAADGSTSRQFIHRREYCEHPRSAQHPELLEGRATTLSEHTAVQGAWVLLEAVPQGVAFAEIAQQLAAKGALGLLTPLYANAEGYLVKRIIAGAPVALPVLSVRADLLPTLAGTRLRANAPVLSHFPKGRNILALRQGTDEHLQHAPLLIGAHYDGIGDDLEGFRLPGATDNAAAVAVLLELARVLALTPSAPSRPVLVVAFDAEEVGAQGSRALARHCQDDGTHPLVLNLDGAACLNETVWVEPGTQTDVLLQTLDRTGRWLDIPLTVGNIASDHRQFAALGFPSVGLSVGATHLHTPSDSLAYVQPEALLRAATLLLATTWQLAWEKA